MRALLALGVVVVVIGRSQAQQKPGYISLTWTTAAVQTKTPFSQTLYESDAARVETIDSVSAGRIGFELAFGFPRWVFQLGAQPPSTWLGERPFRLRYTTFDQNQVITTSDSIEAHFYNASFFFGFGYRFQLPGRNFDISVVPYWHKQIGRFIIHDSLSSVYEEQKEMDPSVRNELPDEIKVELNELTQERTRDFSVGIRVNFSFGMSYKGAGLIFYISPRVQYSYLTVREELYTRSRSEFSNGWSYGGTVGVGLLIGDMPLGKRP